MEKTQFKSKSRARGFIDPKGKVNGNATKRFRARKTKTEDVSDDH